MDICQICLHTDRKLKVVDNRLIEFHDELCEYIWAYSLDPVFCATCEHLLRKMYNFKARCCMAKKILKNRNKLKTAKELLYTLLPPTTLGIWEESKAHVYDYKYDVGLQPLSNINQEPEQDNKMKQPIDQQLSTEAVCLKEEKEILLINFADNVIETNDPLMNEDAIKIEDVVDDLEETLKTHSVLENSKVNLQTLRVLHMGEENITHNASHNLDEKRKTCNVIEDIEQNTITIDLLDGIENIPKSDSESDDLENSIKSHSKLEDLENNIISHSELDDLKELLNSVDVPDDSCLNSADDCDSDDFILNDNVYNRRKKMKEKITIPKQKTQTKTDNSLEQKEAMKKSLLELANISISDEEFINNDSNKQNKEKTGTTKKNVVEKVDRSKITKMRENNRKQVKQKDKQDYTSETVKKMRRRNTEAYSKERFKAILKSKFKSFGELKTEDGTVIDKDILDNIVDKKSSKSKDIRDLWNEVCGTGNSTFTPKALSLLKTIQNLENEYRTVFEIQYLNSEEQVVEEFQKRTTYEGYLKAEFKCDMCHQWFDYKKRLEYHMKTSHDVKVGDFVCTICLTRKTTKRNVLHHMLTHKEVFKCKLCPLVTNYRASMVNHYHQHKGVEYRCGPCNATYRTLSSYKNHMSTACNKQAVPCTRCARTFRSETGLRYHNKRKHLDAPPIDPSISVTCSECDVTFVTEDVYTRHVRISHKLRMNDTSLPRPEIRRNVLTKKRKLKKRKKSSWKPSFTCRVCNAKGQSHAWLALHFNQDHPTIDMSLLYMDKANYLCDICGKAYSTLPALQHHINMHTGTRPYACDQCPARFACRTYLSIHEQVHAPRQIPCDKCGKRFRSRGNLFAHMRSHIGDRRFKCPICGKGFLHSGSVKEHVRGVHDNVKRVKKRPLESDSKSSNEDVVSERNVSLRRVKKRRHTSVNRDFKEEVDSD